MPRYERVTGWRRNLCWFVGGVLVAAAMSLARVAVEALGASRSVSFAVVALLATVVLLVGSVVRSRHREATVSPAGSRAFPP